MKSLLKIYEIFNMYILFGTATKLHHNLPHSGLGSFDAFKTAELFELEDRKTENCFTIWSDRIRHQYANYWEVMDKYKLNDVWEGKPIIKIQEFLSELLGKEVEVQKISVSIDNRGYSVYAVVLCDK